MTGCATSFKAGAPNGAINVIAHRGASAYAPENTLASFALAKEMNADWFELDCNLSKEDEVMVIHDEVLDRTTNGAGKVGDHSLDELKALDAGSWKDAKYEGEQVPTLAEALAMAKEYQIGVYVELKNCDDDVALIMEFMSKTNGHATELSPEHKAELMAMIDQSGSKNARLARRAIEVIREAKMHEALVVQSFSPIACSVLLIEAPELRTEFLGMKDEEHPERWPVFLHWQRWLRPAACNVSLAALDEEVLAFLRSEGRRVNVWTVDEPADMQRLAEWGVDGIITNRPDVCLATLREAGKR